MDSGKRQRGEPKETWKSTLTTEFKNTGNTWVEMEKIA